MVLRLSTLLENVGTIWACTTRLFLVSKRDILVGKGKSKLLIYTYIKLLELELLDE